MAEMLGLDKQAAAQYLTKKLHWEWLESFSMALSMLVGMSAAIVMGIL